MAYDVNKVIKGDQLMCFIGGKAVAFATSHTLNITGNTVTIANKDAGVWGGNAVTTFSWEVTSDNLYSQTEYDALFESMLQRKAVDLVFGYAQGAVDEHGIPQQVTGDAWAPEAGKGYTGKAFITSLNANAATGENATFSVTFSGAGEIKKVAAA